MNSGELRSYMGGLNVRTAYVYIVALDFLPSRQRPTEVMENNLARTKLGFEAHLMDKSITGPVYSSPALEVRDIATNIHSSIVTGHRLIAESRHLDCGATDLRIRGVDSRIDFSLLLFNTFGTNDPPISHVLSRIPIANRIRGRLNTFLLERAFAGAAERETSHFLAFSHRGVAELAAQSYLTELLHPGDIMAYEMRIFMDDGPMASLQDSWVMKSPKPN